MNYIPVNSSLRFGQSLHLIFETPNNELTCIKTDDGFSFCYLGKLYKNLDIYVRHESIIVDPTTDKDSHADTLDALVFAIKITPSHTFTYDVSPPLISLNDSIEKEFAVMVTETNNSPKLFNPEVVQRLCGFINWIVIGIQLSLQ